MSCHMVSSSIGGYETFYPSNLFNRPRYIWPDKAEGSKKTGSLLELPDLGTRELTRSQSGVNEACLSYGSGI